MGIDDPIGGKGDASLPIDLTTDVTGVLPKANGGADFPISLTTEVTGILPFSNGGAGGTALGSIPFGAGGNVLTQDSSNLVWDNTNKRLGIGAVLNTTPGPSQFPLSSFNIKQDFAALRVDNTNASGTALINARSLVAGGSAEVTAERYNTATNGYFSLRTALTGVDWYSGQFATPAALNDDWTFKTSLGGNPIVSITKSGRVGIGSSGAVPDSVLHVRGGGVLVGTAPTGGDKGAGTINAEDIYTDGVLGAPHEGNRNIADADATTNTTDFCVTYTSLTVTRTVTLANATRALGSATKRRYIRIKDESGSASGSVKITIVPESGTIDGEASIELVVPYGSGTVYSNGTSWFTQG